VNGSIFPLTLDQRVARLNELAAEQLNARFPALYSLARGETGGRDPSAAHPFALRESDRRYTADCTGVACWGQGIDRYQLKRFPLYAGWINTDSMLMDAVGEYAVTGGGMREPVQAMFRPVTTTPKPGHLVVFPATYDRGVKTRGSIGHVVTIVAINCLEWPGLLEAADRVTVVHCHGGRRGRSVRAVDRESLRVAMGTSLPRARVIEMYAT
jgi:hypothetical protein